MWNLFLPQGRLPEKLKKRLIPPVDKKKKLGIYSDYTAPLAANPCSTSSLLTPPTSNNVNAMAGLAGMGSLPLLSGFPGVKSSAAANSTSPMFLPFGGLANLGLAANPFFNLAGYGFPNIPGLGANVMDPKVARSSSRASSSASSDKRPSSGSSNKVSHGSSSKSSSRKSSSALSASNAAASSGATSSLPFLFPAPGLLYNPMALGNFNLPQSLPTSFSNLAHSGLLNSLITPSASSTSGTSLTASPAFAMTKPSTSTFSSTSNLASHPLMQDDSDDESLKSLMGNHDDDDFPDDDEFDNPITEPSKKSETSTKKCDSKPESETSAGDSKMKSGSNS